MTLIDSGEARHPGPTDPGTGATPPKSGEPRSAKGWGLLGKRRTAVGQAPPAATPARESTPTAAPALPSIPATAQGADRIRQVIEDALRKAGLMK